MQIDTKVPAVTESLTSDTGISKTDTITSKDSLKGGGDPNAIVHFTVDGTPIAATVTASSTGAWSFTPTGLVDGPHTVVASETDAAGNVGSASLTFTLDTTAPVATGIVASPASGDLDAGNIVALTVTFDTQVYVTGTATPYLTLNDGAKAYYASGTGTNVLVFDYTVASGRNTTALAITGNSAGLVDVAGNAAKVAKYTLPGPLQIDTTAPTVTSVTTSPTSGEGTTGQTVIITLHTSEKVTVSGSPILFLNDGATATYDSVHSTATTLVFDYGVASSDVTTDLVVSGMDLASPSAIADLAGNTANLTGAGANLKLRVNTTSTGTAGPSGGTFAIDGTQDLALFGSSTAAVTFGTGSTGMLSLYNSQSFTGTVAGLTTQTPLDLADIKLATVQTPTYLNATTSGETLHVTDGSHIANIALLGNYLASTFAPTSDGHGGTILTDPPAVVAQNQLTQPHA